MMRKKIGPSSWATAWSVSVCTLRALLTDRRLAVLVLAGGLVSITFTWWEADGLVVLRQQHRLSMTACAVLFTIAAAPSSPSRSRSPAGPPASRQDPPC
jgi:hypothetical protein